MTGITPTRNPFLPIAPTAIPPGFRAIGVLILFQGLIKELGMTVDIETSAVVGVSHPLDPLSRAEISRAVAVLKEGPAAAESLRFISVDLREP